MRQLKFRAIDTNGTMRYGSIVSDKEKPVAIIQQMQNPIQNGSANGWCFAVKPETVGQFIGLPDKNGIEIYEGDILHHPGLEHDAIIGTVAFYNGAFGFNTPVFNQFIPFHDEDGYQTDELEIIGNIHQNPELL